jgi:hypothetical protein
MPLPREILPAEGPVILALFILAAEVSIISPHEAHPSPFLSWGRLRPRKPCKPLPAKGLPRIAPFGLPSAVLFETSLTLSSRNPSKTLIFLVKIICQVKVF